MTSIKQNSKFYHICLVLIIFIFSACANTIIYKKTDFNEPASKNSPKLFLRAISLNSDYKDPNGYQYALFAFPLGRVFIDAPEQQIYSEFAKELTLRGYAPINYIDQTKKNVAKKVIINIKKISLNAYDFFFFRRLVSVIALDVVLFQDNLVLGRAEILEKNSEYRSFGFEPQLTRLFNKTLKSASNEALNRLQLVDRYQDYHQK